MVDVSVVNVVGGTAMVTVEVDKIVVMVLKAEPTSSTDADAKFTMLVPEYPVSVNEMVTVGTTAGALL